MGTSHSKGVTVLFKEKMDFDITEQMIDSNGRYVVFKLKTSNGTFKVFNIYAPVNEYERVKFFNDISALLCDNDENVETIIGGDYNCTLNNAIDRYNCTTKIDIGQIDLKNVMENFDLEDIWRRRNPDVRQFSWEGRGKKSRIDYFLVSKSLDGQIEDINYINAPFSDHSAVHMKIRMTSIKTGRGIWKMNVQTIKTDLFRNAFQSMWNSWRERKNFYDINTWWDLGKKKIKELAVWCSKKIIRERNGRIRELEKQIDILKEAGHDLGEVKVLESQLMDIHATVAEGARIRSRVKWWEEGERSTRYFHQLEKIHGKDQLWDKIIDQDENILQGTDDVQKVQVRFYKDLYASQELENYGMTEHKFLSVAPRQLVLESKEKLERDITLEEITRALSKMMNNKSPGQDGICIEFYKIYWSLIKNDFHEVIINGLEHNQLPYSQYLAIIKLLYKKGNRLDIKNWRPISLLNTDFKILSKTLAERIKIALPEIIHTDQRGCVTGRYIGENIRLLEDIINEKSDDSVIMLLDQEKAFDRVEWDWLFKVLRRFNFGEKFIGWIKTMYQNAKSAIMTNGVVSEYFDISRGIRQGDAMSALLYIIQAEPLAEAIRQSHSIKGIDITNGTINDELKIGQYVDDTIVFLGNSEYIKPCLDIISEYEKVSGAKLNINKTKCLVLRPQNVGKCEGIELVLGPEVALGVPVGKDCQNQRMWENLIVKVEAKLKMWEPRDLSYEGKINIIKSIGLSSVQYAMQMQTVDFQYLKELDKLLWNFLWSGKVHRVAKNICIQPKRSGGLGMVDIHTIIKVKRIQWIIRLLKADEMESWTWLPLKYIKSFDNLFDIQCFVLQTSNTRKLVEDSSIPKFYKDCILYFQELTRKGKCTQNMDNEILWGNHKFQFNNEPLMFQHWAKSGIKYVKDIIKDGELISNEFYDKLLYKAGYMFEIQTIRQSLPAEWLRLGDSADRDNAADSSILNTMFQIPGGGQKPLCSLSAKEIYKILLNSTDMSVRSKEYWSDKFRDLTAIIDWEIWFHVNFINVCMPRKCRDFNWKLFHGCINTEMRLKQMTFSNGICKMCGIHDENVEHLLYTCSKLSGIWEDIEQFINNVFDSRVTLNRLSVLAGILINDEMSAIVNVVISITRFEIWKRRNVFRYENIFIDSRITVAKIRYEIKCHFQILANKPCSKYVKQCIEQL